MMDNEHQENEFPTCTMNIGVVCDPKKRNCEACGWNPDVATARLNRFCRSRKIQLVQEKSGKLT